MTDGGPLGELTLHDLLDATAARTPAPGGGAVAALTLALAAALTAMAARFTDSDGSAVVSADAMRGEAVALADRDGEAYASYLAAVRSSSADSGDALSLATDVPLAMGRLGEQISALAARLAADGKPALLGDATTGALLAAAATRAAATLVELNAGADDPRTRQARQAADSANASADTARSRSHPAL